MINCFIQHHPSRSELLSALIASTGLPTKVVTDNGPLPANPWRGYKLCLESVASSDAQHGVILQDDVVLCKNFGPAIARIVEANDDTPVVLFLSKNPPRISRLALRRNVYLRTWLRINEFLPVVAVLWPRTKASDFLEWASTAKLPGYPRVTLSDDACAGRWACLTKQEIAFTIPSLVEHRLDIPSLVGNDRKGGRVALQFCEGDPLEIDWSK